MYGKTMRELPIINLIFLQQQCAEFPAQGQQKFILATNKGNDSFEANDVPTDWNKKVKITGQFILQNQ